MAMKTSRASNGRNKDGKPETSKTYTCPMHPEIAEDKPGKCPKCGMDLVLKKEVR
jgi:rubrerythrin